MKSKKAEGEKKPVKGTFIILNEDQKKPVPDRMKYFGTVKLKGDPVAYQRKIRDEWE